MFINFGIALYIAHVIIQSVVVHSSSVCEEVDTVFLFNSQIIATDHETVKGIKEFIDDTIYEALGEKSGIGIIPYGDLPLTRSNTMPDLPILGIHDTKGQSTIHTTKIVDDALAKMFSDFNGYSPQNSDNTATLEYALDAAHQLFLTELTGHDAIFVFDYSANFETTLQACINYANDHQTAFENGEHVDEDGNHVKIEAMYYVQIEKTVDGDIEIDEVYDCNNDGEVDDKFAGLSKLHEITCPSGVTEPGVGYMNLKKKINILEVESVIECKIEEEYDSDGHPHVSDSSTMIVDDRISEYMSFEEGYILFIEPEDIQEFEGKGCTFPSLKITAIDKSDPNGDGTWTLKVVEADFLECLQSGHIKYHKDPETPDGGGEEEGNGRRRALTVNLGVPMTTISAGPYDLVGREWKFLEDKLTVSGTGTIQFNGHYLFNLYFGIDLELDLDWCLFIPCGLDYFLFAVRAGIQIDVKVVTTFKGGIEVSYELFEILGSTNTFWISIVPFVYRPRLSTELVAGLGSPYAQFAHTFHVWFYQDYKFGVEYVGHWREISEKSTDYGYENSFDFTDQGRTENSCPTGDVTLGVKVKVGVDLWDTLFVYLALTPALKGEVNIPSDCKGPPCSGDLPNAFEINPSLVLSIDVGYEVLSNWVTDLFGISGLNGELNLLNQAVLYEFPQICLSIPTSLRIPLPTCCQGLMAIRDGTEVSWADQYNAFSMDLFEGNARWWLCNEGYIVAGFYKNRGGADCQGLHCLELMKCVKPIANPPQQDCYEKDISTLFDGAGVVECDAGYFVRGIYSNNNHNAGCGLFCWEALKCCRYEGSELVAGPATESQDWGTCFDWGKKNWCTVDTNDYIVGFYRNSGTWGKDLYSLEEAKTRKIYTLGSAAQSVPEIELNSNELLSIGHGQKKHESPINDDTKDISDDVKINDKHKVDNNKWKPEFNMNDLNDLNGLNDEPSAEVNDWWSKIGLGSDEWIVFGVAVLLVVNAACVAVYCWGRNKRGVVKYDKVSVVSTDVASDEEKLM